MNDSHTALGKLMTVREAADKCGYSKSTLYDAIKLGRLRCYRPKGMHRGIRLTDACLDEWIRGDYREYTTR